jgi:hypothetical protein
LLFALLYFTLFLLALFYQKPKKKIRILDSCFYLSTFSFAEMANPEMAKFIQRFEVLESFLKFLEAF